MSPEIHMSSTARPAKRMRRKSFYILATFVSMLAYAVLLVLSDDQQWLVWPALGAALLGMVFACLWVVALDEAAQQAHYIAWFWGGSSGLVVSLVTFVTVVLRPEPFDAAFSSFSFVDGFAAGIVVGFVPAVVGYAIWWAVLWLRRG